MMAPREVYEAVHAQPFEPFRMVLTDGKSFDVPHPELCSVGTRTTLIFVPAPDDPHLWDRAIRIDNLHIVRLEPLKVHVA